MKAVRATKRIPRVKSTLANPTPAAATEKAPQGVGFDVLRTQINAEVTSNAVEMVRAMIQHAKDGQHQAMKYLFEMIGLYPAMADEERPRDQSLEGFLLPRLEIPPDQKTEDALGPMSTHPDAVE